MAQVALRKIVKMFDKTPAVQGIDLDIADREFIVLVGPSGCGKSTALRMIAGLEEITGGDLYIGDRRVNDVAGFESLAEPIDAFAGIKLAGCDAIAEENTSETLGDDDFRVG